MSGTMEIIGGMLNDSRREVLAKLLNGEEVSVFLESRISLQQLGENAMDKTFYSLLVQAGYLSLKEPMNSASLEATVYIPNVELMIVWKNFILDSLFPQQQRLWTLFDRAHNPALLKSDLEYFLNDRLSYFDLAVRAGDTKRGTEERLYHIFVLGLLSAYKDATCKFPLSNRESGDGRYDILVIKHMANFIIELKASDKEEGLEKTAKAALRQIDEKRYGADFDSTKRLVRIGIAFCGKSCWVEIGEKGK